MRAVGSGEEVSSDATELTDPSVDARHGIGRGGVAKWTQASVRTVDQEG